MLEFEEICVQQKFTQPKLLLEEDILLVVSVFFVSDNIVSDVREVSSDLMSSARVQVNLQQAVAAGWIPAGGIEGDFSFCQNPKTGLCFLQSA